MIDQDNSIVLLDNKINHKEKEGKSKLNLISETNINSSSLNSQINNILDRDNKKKENINKDNSKRKNLNNFKNDVFKSIELNTNNNNDSDSLIYKPLKTRIHVTSEILEKNNLNHNNNLNNKEENKLIYSNENEMKETKDIKIFGKKIINESQKQKNPIQIYDKNNIMNLDLLNEMIAISNASNEPKQNKIIDNNPSKLSSELDIIKEEQNESDKKSENDCKNNSPKDISKPSFNQNGNNNEENNNKIKELDNIIKTFDKDEINKLADNNIIKAENLITDLNNDLINDMNELTENNMNNIIDEFMLNSRMKLQELKIMNDICNKIKDNINKKYEYLSKITDNEIKDFEIFYKYDKLFDYIILIQNELEMQIDNSNCELRKNINYFQGDEVGYQENCNSNRNKKLEIDIEDAKQKLTKINDLINIDINKNSQIDDDDNPCSKIEIINKDFKDNDNESFFEIIDFIYRQILNINKEHENFLLY